METAVRSIVGLLVRGQYETIERMDRGGRVTADDLRRAVDEYGRTLMRPPGAWWDLVTVTPITGGDEDRIHVAAPLWTDEEGRSDLTLELELIEFAPEAYEAAIQDLHVL